MVADAHDAVRRRRGVKRGQHRPRGPLHVRRDQRWRRRQSRVRRRLRQPRLGASSTDCGGTSSARPCSPGRARAVRPLLTTGNTMEALGRMHLGDLPDSSAHRQLHAWHAELGIPSGDDDPLLVTANSDTECPVTKSPYTSVAPGPSVSASRRTPTTAGNCSPSATATRPASSPTGPPRAARRNSSPLEQSGVHEDRVVPAQRQWWAASWTAASSVSLILTPVANRSASHAGPGSGVPTLCAARARCRSGARPQHAANGPQGHPISAVLPPPAISPTDGSLHCWPPVGNHLWPPAGRSWRPPTAVCALVAPVDDRWGGRAWMGRREFGRPGCGMTAGAPELSAYCRADLQIVISEAHRGTRR